MKKIFQLILVGILSIQTGAFAQVSFSKWQAQPIVIDGDGSDWVTIPRFFNASSNIKYEFRNDAENLYIIISPADRNTQLQLSAAGFNIKLKLRTSTPERFSIMFQAPKMGMMPPPQMNQDKLVEKTILNSESMSKDTATVEGFLFTKGKIVSENTDEKSISFAHSKQASNSGVYEIRIPLREIYGNGFKLETVSATPVQLQVNINELSQKGMKKMTSRMAGGMHGGGRGMRGGGRGMGGDREMEGGMPGETEGREDEERSQMQAQGMGNMAAFEKKSFSIDFQLSTGK